jgi:hypothetical protein
LVRTGPPDHRINAGATASIHPLLTVTPAQNIPSTLSAEVSEHIRRSRVLGVRSPALHDSFVRTPIDPSLGEAEYLTIQQIIWGERYRDQK